MESQNETGCQAPDVSVPCINNCGLFGTAATMSMCPKCHKEMTMKEEQANLTVSSIGSTMTSNTSFNAFKPLIAGNATSNTSSNAFKPLSACNASLPFGPFGQKNVLTVSSSHLFSSLSQEMKAKKSCRRCITCRKRVGLTGFNCKCGNIFCAVHRYSDKHDCPFDYRTAARNEIAKANPVVKPEKLNKI